MRLCAMICYVLTPDTSLNKVSTWRFNFLLDHNKDFFSQDTFS